ncbi:hypothetical protein L1987_83596 [Smallanthus sonchifolius]|uniref:Uncharacterized protein n=1 Tax=Smallanthus sonchifolius TaxID=185202 RepID=A0ACB8YD08_9ASTR|nr:hypothetical protein L1987_83596 [Smallanthus sonchifolius]
MRNTFPPQSTGFSKMELCCMKRARRLNQARYNPMARTYLKGALTMNHIGDLPTDDSAKERIKKEHSGGQLIDALDIEFENGNKPVAYASLHGHAFYSKPGLVLQGSGGIGIRNDASKGQRMMDTGDTPMVVAAEYLGRAVVEPPWLNYSRKWGPKISYDIRNEINKVRKVLPNVLRGAFDKFVGRLPNELLGEEGPTGPKMKNNWSGDEKY